jgi:isoamyl acetate esterase
MGIFFGRTEVKKVLLLGDSIRVNYQSSVQDKLSGLCEVVWPDENCRFAKYTLWCINDWIKSLGEPDFVHWNNGIWDIFRIDDDIGVFTEISEYIHDIRRIIQLLRKTKATIIWASTTPIIEPHPFCRNADIDIYNRTAAEVMINEKIPINDFNSMINENIKRYLCDDLVHLSNEGIEICAEKIAHSIKQFI